MRTNLGDLELEDLVFKEDAEALEGVEFEGYRVVRVLGRGAGGGAVYEVWSATGGKRAAAKWPVHSAELEALADLDGCLGVPVLFAQGDLKGRPYAVTEILGKPLSEVFSRLGKKCQTRRWQAVCVVGRLLIRRLRVIHSRGWLHCDLKPDNVILGSPWGAPGAHHRPYFIDYGNSRRHPGGPAMRGDWGSVDFNSIASAAGGERFPCDDVEALGWLLLHLLVGDLPWFPITKATDWKDREKRMETVQEVRKAKAQALDVGWYSFGERWRGLLKLPEALEEFLHVARALEGKKPEYTHLARLLGAREGVSQEEEESEDLALLPLALEEARLGASAQERENGKMLWVVVGGSDSGGLVVRAEKGTDSAAKEARLACGAVVQQEALEGSRLCYRRLSGEGPETGWVSTKIKERELLVRWRPRGTLLDPAVRRRLPPPPKPKEPGGWWVDWDSMLQELAAPGKAAAKAVPEDARMDLLVYGATGFTGTLACEMLAKGDAGKLTWGIAGRDGRKLELLAERFGAGCASFRGAAAASSAAQLSDLVRRAKVVLDFSGPAFQVGATVAFACATAGVHYVETSCYEGDVLAARAARERLHSVAANSGAALLFFCAAFPVQVDFGVWWVTKHVKERFGAATRRVDVFQHQANMVLGGTPVLSFLGHKDHVSQAARLSPFILGGARPEGPREEDFDEPVAQQHEESGLWLFPGGRNAEVMIARCSSGLLEQTAPYGRRFLLKVWDVHKAKADAEASSQHNAFLRKSYSSLLEQGKVPPPGHGPPKDLRQRGSFARVFEAKSDEPQGKRRKVHCLVHAGSRSIGDACEGTALVALQAACCLLRAEPGQLRSGFGTPVWHLAHLNFGERLRDIGYWNWTQVEKGAPSGVLLHRVASWGGQ